ncbi:hypothetical protein D3C80_2121740 [compost metagenome]
MHAAKDAVVASRHRLQRLVVDLVDHAHVGIGQLEPRVGPEMGQVGGEAPDRRDVVGIDEGDEFRVV